MKSRISKVNSEKGLRYENLFFINWNLKVSTCNKVFYCVSKNYISQIWALLSKAHIQAFQEVFHCSHLYILWNSGDFFFSGFLEIFKSLILIFININLEISPQQKVAETEIKKLRRGKEDLLVRNNEETRCSRSPDQDVCDW